MKQIALAQQEKVQCEIGFNSGVIGVNGLRSLQLANIGKV
jgi:hypothetical protein